MVSSVSCPVILIKGLSLQNRFPPFIRCFFEQYAKLFVFKTFFQFTVRQKGSKVIGTFRVFFIDNSGKVLLNR